MVSGDFVVWQGDEKEGVSVFASDFDIGFVTGAVIIDITFVGLVEEMAVWGSGLGIVEDSLVWDRDSEDISQDTSGFSGSDGEGDVEGKYQTDNIWAMVDFC